MKRERSRTPRRVEAPAEQIPPSPSVPSIQFRPGVYAKGRTAITQILEAALDILIREGIRAVTLRRIAAACGLRIGNVTYYFSTKEELLRAVLDVVMAAYSDALQNLQSRKNESAETRFGLFIRIVLEDISGEATTNLFPELWAMANHDDFVADAIKDMYRRARDNVLLNLIAELNPGLDAEEREAVAVFIQAATEGMTIFAGHNKPFSARMPWIESISIKALTDLVRTIDSASIRKGVQPPLWRRF